MDDRLREFLTEPAESLAKLEVENVQLEQNPNNPERLGSIFRFVHTADYEKNLATLDPCWQDVSAGIYCFKNSLFVILDVARLLRGPQQSAA